jgi:hypothetical protein
VKIQKCGGVKRGPAGRISNPRDDEDTPNLHFYKRNPRTWNSSSSSVKIVIVEESVEFLADSEVLFKLEIQVKSKVRRFTS